MTLSDPPADCRQCVLLENEHATDALARSLAAALAATLAATRASALPPAVREAGGGAKRIHLSGDLGAGKTRFARALLRGLGHTGRVRSPTFTLLETYDLSSFRIYHFDFYRFAGKNEWRDAGFDEAFDDPQGVCLIEWPEMAGDTLPRPDLSLTLEFAAHAAATLDDEPTTRRIAQLQAHAPWAQNWLSRLRQSLSDDGPREGVSLRPG